MNNDTNNPVYQMVRTVRNRIRDSLFKGTLDYDNSTATLKRYLTVAADMNHPLMAGQVTELLGTIELQRGEFNTAYEYYSQSLQYFKSYNDLQRVGILLGKLGELYRVWGKPDQAAKFFERSRVNAQQAGDRRGEVITYTNEGLLWVEEGDPQLAASRLEKALQLAQDMTVYPLIKEVLPDIYVGLAQSHLLLSNFAQAWKYANETLRLSTEVNRMSQIAAAYRIMARIAAMAPELRADPAALFEQSRSYWQQLHAKAELAKTLMLEGNYWFDENRPDQGMVCYMQAMQYYDDMKMRDRLRDVQNRLGDL
ncbi:MAG: tetratricopeptide repeat protein [Anaerolineales bacterium]|nr:tetratricopeptide repeat protein [Anaerolineales bacterium]